MTEPRPISLEDMVHASLSPRFGVEQGVLGIIALRVVFCIAVLSRPGLKPDGSIKIRPIDDMTVSMINAATHANDKLPCDTLDLFFASMQCLEGLVKGHKKLWKADIDVAFHRVPIRPDHR
jgi:hypothetical protein